MGSALLNPPPPHDADQPSAASAEALRLQVAERLAAHRDRRSRQRPQPTAPAMPTATPTGARAARIAATVANRYAQSQSYRAFLAAEAERAVQQAHAAADVAARNAQAAVQAQQQLLEDLENAAVEQARLEEETRRQELLLQPTPNLWPELDQPGEFNQEQDAVSIAAPTQDSTPSERPTSSPKTSSRTKRPSPEPSIGEAPGLTVHLFRDAAQPSTTTSPVPHPSRPYAMSGTHSPEISPSHYGRRRYDHEDALEASALDDEIAFRHTPVFEEPAGPPTPLPANLIEFPRQLVAPRKARPRHAEGPLREENAPESGDTQLRIFEVDPAHISITPDLVDTETPQWTSLWLDTVASQYAASGLASDAENLEIAPQQLPRPQPAAVARRLQAAALDAALVFTGFLASAAAASLVVNRTAQFMQLSRAVAAAPALSAATAALSLAFLYILYQALFFTLSEATPGMRLARIALCTLSDDNPTRRAMRRRIPAVILSILPAGIGLAWAFLDEDRLPWHDRLSRMYQRSY